MAAVHDAGHIVIVRAVGIEVWSAWIGPNMGEAVKRTWIGDVGFSKSELEKADDVSRRDGWRCRFSCRASVVRRID
jgi:hypothetical protein